MSGPTSARCGMDITDDFLHPAGHADSQRVVAEIGAMLHAAVTTRGEHA